MLSKLLRKVSHDPAILAFLAASIIAVTMSCGAVIFYYRTHDAYEEQIRENIAHLAVVLAASVDGQAHRRLIGKTQESDPDYQSILIPIRKLKSHLPEARFIYTLFLVDGKIRFGVDSTPAGDADGDGVEDHSFLMDPYEDAPMAALQALVESRATTTPDYYQDKWGTFFSGYAPIHDSSGAPAGVLAIDITQENYLRNMADFRKLLIVSVLISILMASLGGFLLYKVLVWANSAETQYRIVSESVSDAIIVIDSNSRIRYINRAVEPILGYKPAELTGQSLMQVIPAELKKKHFDAMSRYLATGKRGFAWEAFEMPAVKKDGTQAYLEVSISEFSRNGRKFFTGVIRDIARRKLIEQKEKEAMDAKLQFLSVVTHELRTPLTVVKESIGIVEEQIAGPLNAEQTKFLVIAKKNLARLARLVNNVLDYQKLEARRTELVKEPVDTKELLTEVSKNYELVAAEKNLVLSVEAEAALPKVSMDRDRIVQVLANFVDNAIKYSPADRLIRLTAARDGDAVKICVADQGRGMNRDEMTKLFQVFSQLSNAKENKVPGTGLGLSIAKKIVELHGGSVGADSTAGQGSIFYFRLPI